MLSEPPQLQYVRALEEDPDAFEHRVLLDLSIAFARDLRGGDEPVRVAFRHAFRVFLRWLRNLVGHYWPLSIYLHWRDQRKLKAMRLKRGLSPRKG